MFVVAGATGRVGSSVAAELLDRRERVRVIARQARSAAAWAERGAEVAVGDLGDRAFLARALDDARGLFALLPEDVTAPDFPGARRVIADAVADAVADAAMPHVVVISSVAVETPAPAGPITGLAYFERRLREGTVVTSVRSAYFQDNVASAITPARQAGVVPNFGATDDVPIPMTATADAGRVAAECLIRPPETHDSVAVLGPICTMRDVAAALGRALGRSVHVRNIPEAEWPATLLQAGMSRSAAAAFSEMFGALGRGELQPAARRFVAARTTLDETIARLLR